MGIFRHVTPVSRDAEREITRDHPGSGRHGTATFSQAQVEAMSDRARSRGNASAADELARAAEEAAKTPTREVAFLKFGTR